MSDEPGDAQLAEGRLTLASGRKVVLRSLDQQRTYGGLMEGVPTRDLNDRIVARAVETAAGGWGSDHPPALIDPPRRDFAREPGDSDESRGFRDQPVEYLPGVVCVAVLVASAPARSEAADWSELAVVWFQDRFALPIDPAAFDQIRAIDWNKLAADCDY